MYQTPQNNAGARQLRKMFKVSDESMYIQAKRVAYVPVGSKGPQQLKVGGPKNKFYTNQRWHKQQWNIPSTILSDNQ